MLRVALKEYQSRIEGLIEENRLPEAAAHCHFLLQQYPRHIGTYRLFGRALLEQQLYNDTLDIFKRVISADPEDLLAHAGLALAYREKQDLSQALWHMKRAFEMEPYNRAIQQELRDLYERIGSEPVRVHGLNKAALARIYFKGGLYSKASVETKALLEAYPDRFDLQVLLADIYYWADRRQDADQQCQFILHQLPFCIKANAILADLCLRKGRIREAKEHLSTLQSITLMAVSDVDPESTVGSVLSSHPDITLPEQISVDALGEIGPASAQLSYDSEWLREIGVEEAIESATTPAVEDYDVMIDTSVQDDTSEILDEEEIDWLEDVTIADITNMTYQEEEVTDLPAELIESVDEEALSLSADEEIEKTVESQEASMPEEEEVVEDELFIGDFGDELPSWVELNEEVDLMGSQASEKTVDDGWLAQIAPSQETDDGLPRWIYENMGFSEEMKDSPDFELPEWLQESLSEEETTGEEPELPDQPTVTEPPATQAPTDESESETVPEEVEQIDEELSADESQDIDWLEPTIEELLTGTDELIDRATAPAPDQLIDAAFDNLPWLDDMFAGDEANHEDSAQPSENIADDDTNHGED